MLRLDLLHELCSRLVGVVGHEHHPLLESQQIIHRGHGGFGILVIGWISPHFPGGKVQKNAWNHRLYSNSSPLPKRNWWHASWRKLPFPKICVFSNHHPGSQPQPYKIQSTEKRPIIFGMIFWIPRTHLHQLKGNMAGQPHFPKNRFRPTLDFVLRFKKKHQNPRKRKKNQGKSSVHRLIADTPNNAIAIEDVRLKGGELFEPRRRRIRLTGWTMKSLGKTCDPPWTQSCWTLPERP